MLLLIYGYYLIQTLICKQVINSISSNVMLCAHVRLISEVLLTLCGSTFLPKERRPPLS